jgi:hypothetical protein
VVANLASAPAVREESPAEVMLRGSA